MSETVATAPADVPVSTSGKVGARRSSRIWIVSGIALAVASGGALWLLAARTAIRSSLAEQQHAQDEQRRYQSLAASGATSRNDAERFKTTANTAEQDAAHASAMLDVAQNQAQVIHAQRAEIQAALALDKATQQKELAALDMAQQDQRHATIT